MRSPASRSPSSYPTSALAAELETTLMLDVREDWEFEEEGHMWKELGLPVVKGGGTTITTPDVEGERA